MFGGGILVAVQPSVVAQESDSTVAVLEVASDCVTILVCLFSGLSLWTVRF